MITKTTSEDAIIEYLADKRTRKILGLTSKNEYSAIDLSEELGTSISTVYRKLKLLEDTGLIQHVKTIINHRGNEEKYYRCTIHEVKISFKGDELSFSLDKKDYRDKYVRFGKMLSYSNNGKIMKEKYLVKI
jgi:predicted transcriptional regulator